MLASTYQLNLIGQKKAWSTLVSYSKKGLPSGLLFLGPAGVGKRRAAEALFQYMLCTQKNNDQACGACAQCKTTSEGAHHHPDFVLIQRQGQLISVDSIRELKKTIHFAPMEAPVRFIVINDAHHLGVAAANSILKILEEPPAHTRFFLITSERTKVLPTILSRCQFVYFSPLEEDFLLERWKAKALENQIETQKLPPVFLQKLPLLFSGGLCRHAILTQPEIVEKLLEFERALSSAFSIDQVIHFAEKWAEKPDSEESFSLELVIDYAIASLSQVIRRTANPTLIQTVFDLNQLRTKLEFNANRKLSSLAASIVLEQGLNSRGAHL